MTDQLSNEARLAVLEYQLQSSFLLISSPMDMKPPLEFLAEIATQVSPEDANLLATLSTEDALEQVLRGDYTLDDLQNIVHSALQESFDVENTQLGSAAIGLFADELSEILNQDNVDYDALADSALRTFALVHSGEVAKVVLNSGQSEDQVREDAEFDGSVMAVMIVVNNIAKANGVDFQSKFSAAMKPSGLAGQWKGNDPNATEPPEAKPEAAPEPIDLTIDPVPYITTLD